MANDLDKIVPIIFAALKDESGKNDNINDEVGLDSDSEDEIEENGIIKNIKVNEEFIDAKCSAIYAINSICKSCPKEFFKYIPDTFSMFDSIFNLFDENINIEIILAYE